MFQRNVVGEIKAYFTFTIYFFESRAISEIMWKDMIDPGRPQMTTQYEACALHAG